MVFRKKKREKNFVNKNFLLIFAMNLDEEG
jgi:hypothetical protein